MLTFLRNLLSTLLGTSVESRLLRRLRRAGLKAELVVTQQAVLGLPDSSRTHRRTLARHARRLRKAASRSTRAQLALHRLVNRPGVADLRGRLEKHMGPARDDDAALRRRPLLPHWISVATPIVILGVDFLFFLGLWRDLSDARGWWNTATLSSALLALLTPLIVFVIAMPLGRLAAATFTFAEHRTNGRYGVLGALTAALLGVCGLFAAFASYRFQQEQAGPGATRVPTGAITVLFAVLPAIAALVHGFVSLPDADEHGRAVRDERLLHLRLTLRLRSVRRVSRRQADAWVSLADAVQRVLTEADLAVNRAEMLVADVRADGDGAQLAVDEGEHVRLDLIRAIDTSLPTLSESTSGFTVPDVQPVQTTSLPVPPRLIRLLQTSLETLTACPPAVDSGKLDSVADYLDMLEPGHRIRTVGSVKDGAPA